MCLKVTYCLLQTFLKDVTNIIKLLPGLPIGSPRSHQRTSTDSDARCQVQNRCPTATTALVLLSPLELAEEYVAFCCWNEDVRTAWAASCYYTCIWWQWWSNLGWTGALLTTLSVYVITSFVCVSIEANPLPQHVTHLHFRLVRLPSTCYWTDVFIYSGSSSGSGVLNYSRISPMIDALETQMGVVLYRLSLATRSRLDYSFVDWVQQILLLKPSFVFLFLTIFLLVLIQGYYKRNRHFQRHIVSNPLA